ncbi:hypothetical protein GQ53DRAFT_831848 [Thozetella sp. PMI_491]|nr:hypothetical protein GQ53DRAFT_831848 [Thozetella sp. PMI_491]
MRFSAIAACILATTSAVIAAPLEGNTGISTRQTFESSGIVTRDGELDRRLDPVTLSILTSAAGAAGAWATTQALDGIKSLVSSAANWNKAREAFTKATMDKMMANIKADASFKGAVCYNMGYDINDKSKISAVTSVNFKSGVLKTDYDCFYMKSGAKFTGKGDGGFINIATNSMSGACPYDSKTVSVTCK